MRGSVFVGIGSVLAVLAVLAACSPSVEHPAMLGSELAAGRTLSPDGARSDRNDGENGDTSLGESGARPTDPSDVAPPREGESISQREPSAPSRAFSPEDYEAHLADLRSRVEGFDEYTVVIEPPFVVIGDEAPRRVRSRSKQTVRWAVDRLKALYFDEDPEAIIDIWLFRDETSYRTHARELFGDDPGTPFGYYSSTHRALIMNIATGGGTLVHEIVHPFIESNFPACPAWFNEGLASLYEQSEDRNGRIRGLTNWRLEGLQRAIRAGGLPSFETLCRTSTREFYQEDPGTNYAQARYLCYWLQQTGRLTAFYRRFRASAGDDPSGLEALRRVLETADLPAVQEDWERWILGLRFPEARG